MKRFAYILAAVLLLGAIASCHKDKPAPSPSTAPTITWEGNERFAAQEISPVLDATVQVAAEEGIFTLQISVKQMPVELIGVVNAWISIDNNKGSSSKAPKFDLLKDSKAVKQLVDSKVLASAPTSGAMSCSLNLGRLIDSMTENQVLTNKSKFTFEIAVTDSEGQSLTKTATFNWTSAPEITLSSETVALTKGWNTDVKATIAAEGKIETLVVSFGGASADQAFLSWVRKRTVDGKTDVDLVNEADAAAAFGFPSAASVSDKTAVTINFKDLLSQVSYEMTSAETSTEITVKVTDQLQKTTSATLYITHSAE